MKKKFKETAPIKKEIRRMRRRLTNKEKKVIVDKIENTIEKHKKKFPRTFSTKSKLESRKCPHMELFIEVGGYLICRYCGDKFKKI